MVLKRGLSFKEGNGTPLLYQDNQQQQQRNQRLKFTNCQCKENLWLQAYSGQLETLIRKVVREEVQQVIQHSCHSISRLLPSQAKPCESRKFKLQFEGNLPHKLFTGNKVEAEGPSPVRLLLLDATSGHRVIYGPLSSIRVKVVVLHGHFKAENWTPHEFDDNIVFERDGKRPLLVGQHVVVALQNGMGSVGDICFTDNSSWERSKMFRLGAKVLTNEDVVMEAVSSPFEVKDRRGEIYQKHHIPSPEDEVWRLSWIAKDGKICKRLAEHQIYNVKDLVTQYNHDECLLRQVLKVSPKKWQQIIQQATSCFSDSPSDTSRSEVAAHFDSPISSKICTSTVPALQQCCMPPSFHYEQDSQMSRTSEQSHQLDQSMNQNNFLLEDLLSDSCKYNDHVYLSSLADSRLSSFPSMVDYESSSNWFSSDQSMWETDKFFCDDPNNNNLDIGMHPKPSPSLLDASDSAETKEGWGKVQGFWKIMFDEHDELALKKGKFPCYSQQAVYP